MSRYGTEEFGTIAVERPKDQKHVLNLSSVIVEILAIDKDVPVEPGQMGRIVVTDLFSHAMPLIRYETGDLAVLAPPKEGEFPIL